MKNRLALFLVALVPAIVSAVPIDAMPKKQVEASDQANWEGGMVLSGQTLEFVQGFLDAVDVITLRLKDCVEEGAIKDPNKNEKFEKLFEALTVSMATTKSFGNQLSKDKCVQAGNKRANGLVAVSQSVGNLVRKEPRLLVENIIVRKMPERYYKWNTAVKFLINMGFVGHFRKIDRGYHEFQSRVDTMVLRGPKACVTGTEMLTVSHLDEFVESSGRLRPWFDNGVRVLDKYLLIMSKDARDEYETDVKKLKEASLAANTALGVEFDRYAEMAINLYPKDREVFDKFYKQWSAFLEMVDESVKASEELIKQVDDKSGEVGKLRNCAEFSPYGAFRLNGSVQNCCPKYYERIKFIFEACKVRYLTHLKNLHRDYPNDTSIPKGWE